MKLDRDHWQRKFLLAFRGIRVGMTGQSSFLVHFLLLAAVFVAAVLLNVNLLEWCVLVLCIGTVISAELFNSALEHMAKSISRDYDPHLRDALDIASGAVLAISLAAAVVGLILFGFRFGLWMGWWGGYLII